MTKRRDLVLDEFNISKKRYRELYNFCLQYSEFKQKLALTESSITTNYSEVAVKSNSVKSKTEEVGTTRVELQEKIKLIEDTVMQADTGIYKWLLYAVTTETCTYKVLKMQFNIPCSEKYFNKQRRKFFYLLDKNKE